MAEVWRPGAAGFKSQVRVQVEGLEDVLASLTRLDKQSKEPIRVALKGITQKMANEAKAITPDDPETQGALRDSVRIINPVISRTAGRITGGIMAGGKALEARLGGHRYSAWALVQHEDLTLAHPHGGEAKYLEKPFFRHIDEVPGVITDAIGSLREGA